MNFRDDREGPEHEPLSDLIADNLRRVLPPTMRSRVRIGIRSLYEFRLLADYRPRAAVRESVALDALRLANTIANTARSIIE